MILEKIFNFLKLVRVKHYLKNFLIFLPIIFSGNLFQFNSFFKTIIGFFVFSFTCSIVYIINDINDKEKDKLHDKKKNRPIASGKISVKEALCLIGFLVVIVGFSIICTNLRLYSFLYVIIYFVINIAYSFGFKNVVLLDIIILTIGFILRVLFGASIIGVEVSNWLYLTVISMAFYLALGKRRGEIIKTSEKTRKVLQYYTKEFLDKCMYMCLTLAIVFYSLWTVDIHVIDRINSNLVWTVPVVIIICMRYSMIIESDNDGDPVEVVVHDKALLFLILTYATLLIGLLYI